MVVGAYFETNVVWRPVCTGVGTVDERTRARQTRKPWPKQNDGESLMCVSMPAIKVQTLTPSWAAMPCCADRDNGWGDTLCASCDSPDLVGTLNGCGVVA